MSAMPGTKSNAAPPTPCSQYSLNFFFPPEARDGQPTPGEINALRVCATCPLASRRTCLERELKFPAYKQHGVVGGTTASQRRSILRARRRAELAKAA